MTWYNVHCKLCNNNIMVEHKTELPIICPFCRNETMEYVTSVSEEAKKVPESRFATHKESKTKTKSKKVKRMNKEQVKKLWNLQDEIRKDAKEMKMTALIEKYNASYPVLKKIIEGTWRPKLGEHVGGPGRKGEANK